MNTLGRRASFSNAEQLVSVPAAETILETEEALVADARAELSPAQMVERKLSNLLRGKLLLVSQVRLGRLPGQRGKG